MIAAHRCDINQITPFFIPELREKNMSSYFRRISATIDTALTRDLIGMKFPMFNPRCITGLALRVSDRATCFVL